MAWPGNEYSSDGVAVSIAVVGKYARRGHVQWRVLARAVAVIHYGRRSVRRLYCDCDGRLIAERRIGGKHDLLQCWGVLPVCAGQRGYVLQISRWRTGDGVVCAEASRLCCPISGSGRAAGAG